MCLFPGCLNLNEFNWVLIKAVVNRLKSLLLPFSRKILNTGVMLSQEAGGLELTARCMWRPKYGDPNSALRAVSSETREPSSDGTACEAASGHPALLVGGEMLVEVMTSQGHGLQAGSSDQKLASGRPQFLAHRWSLQERETTLVLGQTEIIGWFPVSGGSVMTLCPEVSPM